ncbi:hypothetical protein [Edaphobacter aggregans]|nr:hypothetical protein [Edaphobacter aggregans]
MTAGAGLGTGFGAGVRFSGAKQERGMTMPDEVRTGGGAAWPVGWV